VYVSYRFLPRASGVFSTEINIAMPSCDGWGGRYIHDGAILCGFGQLLELSAMTDLTLDDNVLGGSVKLKISSPVALIAQPCYSVSQSEGGLEKIMQAVTLTLEWALRIDEVVVSLEISEGQGTTITA
jgi:4-alpha-glucanotransferase